MERGFIFRSNHDSEPGMPPNRSYKRGRWATMRRYMRGWKPEGLFLERIATLCQRGSACSQEANWYATRVCISHFRFLFSFDLEPLLSIFFASSLQIYFANVRCDSATKRWKKKNRACQAKTLFSSEKCVTNNTVCYFFYGGRNREQKNRDPGAFCCMLLYFILLHVLYVCIYVGIERMLFFLTVPTRVRKKSK